MIVISVDEDVADLRGNEDFVIAAIDNEVINRFCDLEVVVTAVEIIRVFLNIK